MPNTIVLQPGQTIKLPSDVVVTSIIVNQDATIESTCTNLPDPDEYVCIRYNFAVSDAGNPSALQDLTLNFITIGGTTYNFNVAIVGNTAVSNILSVKDMINNAMGAIFKVYSASAELNAFSDRFEYALAVKVPASLKEGIIFNMSGTGYPGPPGFNLNYNDQSGCGCLDSTNKEQFYCDTNL